MNRPTFMLSSRWVAKEIHYKSVDSSMSWPGSPGAPIPRRALPPPCDPVVAARGTIPHDGFAVRLERGENLAGTPPASRAPPAGHVRKGIIRRPPARHPGHDGSEKQGQVQRRTWN